jgi:hypothetical protein
MTAGWGDSVLEAVKRNIGDSEPGESKDPMDKKSKTGKEEGRGPKRSTGEWKDFAKRQISEQKKERMSARSQEKVWT